MVSGTSGSSVVIAVLWVLPSMVVSTSLVVTGTSSESITSTVVISDIRRSSRFSGVSGSGIRHYGSE